MHSIKARRGFSLVEMMVVIVIIGMLAAAVTVGVQNYIATSRNTIAKMEIKKISEAVELYQTTHAKYPDNLSVLYSKDETGHAPLNGVNKDPWGTPYEIFINEEDEENPFEVVSFGADKKQGGTGSNKDISNLDFLSDDS